MLTFCPCRDCPEHACDVARMFCGGAHRGGSEAIVAREIERALDFGRRDGRAARDVISHLRQAHSVPICSTSVGGVPGYFFPTNLDEAQWTVTQLRSRLGEIQKTLRGVERGLEEMWPAQERLFA